MAMHLVPSSRLRGVATQSLHYSSIVSRGQEPFNKCLAVFNGHSVSTLLANSGSAMIPESAQRNNTVWLTQLLYCSTADRLISAVQMPSASVHTGTP
jgi:hypothetical protein